MPTMDCALGALEHGVFEIGADVSEIGVDVSFNWWLWVPTLVKSGHIAMGEGIKSAWIRTDGHTYAEFWFVRPSGDASKISLKVHKNNAISISK